MACFSERGLAPRGRRGGDLRPALTAPVSAVPALFATARARSGPLRPVKTAPQPALEVILDGTERAGTRPDGREQGRNIADGCGEDRVLDGCQVSDQ